MRWTRTTTLTTALLLVASAALAGPVSGVGDASEGTRIGACRSAIRSASGQAENAATDAQRSMSNTILVSAQLSACDCEENPESQLRWRCIVSWQLVALPAATR